MNISPITSLNFKKVNYKKAAFKVSLLNRPCFDSVNFKGKTATDNISIIQAQSDDDLSQNIIKRLNIKPSQACVKNFENGETYVNLKQDIQEKDAYILPNSNKSVNDKLMEIYLKADAAKRAGAKRVIAIMPCFDYARQEKKTEDGEAIAAKLNLDLLKASGVDKVIALDMHTPALSGFVSSDMQIIDLKTMPIFEDYIKSKGIENLVIVSPDVGGAKKATKLSQEMNCEKAIVYKHRYAHNEAVAQGIIGDVKDKNCVIYDDIIDTAGTISEAARILKDNGAKDIYVMASHGLFNGKSMERLEKAPIREVVVTNSIPLKQNAIGKIKQLDVSQTIVDAIEKISQG